MMKLNCYWVAQNIDGSIFSQLNGISFDTLNRKYLKNFTLLYKSNKILDISLAKGSVIAYRKRTFIYDEVYRIMHLIYYHSDVVSIYLVDDQTGKVKRYNHFGQDEQLYNIEFTSKDLAKVSI